MWTAKDKNGGLRFHDTKLEKKTDDYFDVDTIGTIFTKLFPEVTFENNLIEVELKLL